jgi:hypothetical protein
MARIKDVSASIRRGCFSRAVVVEEVALNVGLAGPVEKGEFIGPQIRVIAFHVGIVQFAPMPSLCATASWTMRASILSGWAKTHVKHLA